MGLQSFLRVGMRSAHVAHLTGGALLVTAIGLAIGLRALPYSSSTFSEVGQEEASLRPTPDFRLGPLVWPVVELKGSPAFAPFRQAFREACGTKLGLSAAGCAAAELARRSPFGQPKDEFVDRKFDPQDHFQRHLTGEPGHCLTRSAILATQLLSVGVPARVVQMLPADGRGHTVVEVWDECCGWTLVDPTFGGMVRPLSRSASAAALQAAPENARWSGIRSPDFPPGSEQDRLEYVRGALKGHLVYPEPWLYLRMGSRVAPWPFRNHVVRIGPQDLWLGPVQRLLQVVIPIVGLAGLGFLALAWYRRPALAEAHRPGGRAVSGVTGSRVLRDADVFPPA